ncbi:MAG TPA: glycosyltransferase family 1 protein [Phycisphaerales bacterium]|nr:glycosyltransferase family 1 protein [Phycisphaerales bacterium]
MRILIFEPDHGGHRFTYVRHLISGLLEVPGVGPITLVCTTEATDSDEYANQIRPIEDRITVAGEVGVISGSQDEVAKQRLSALEHAIAAHPADHLYVPSADGLTQLLGMRTLIPGRGVIPRSMTSEAAMHRGSFAYPAPGLKRRLKVGLGFKAIQRSPWTHLHFVDPLGYEAAVKLSPRLADRCSVLADPVDKVAPMDKAKARRKLGIEPGGRWIGTAGVIDARKGCDRLIEAFDLSSTGDSDRLLLAGRLHEDIKALIDSRYAHLVEAGRLVAFDRYISDEELAWSLSAMDVVVTAHPAHVGLSNIALRALAANRFVLGSSFGWLGRVVPTFGMGVVCDVKNTMDFAGAIGQSLDAAEWYTRTPAGDRLLEFHSLENHIAGWTSLVRRELGLPATEVKTWAWALQGAGT